jgi:acetylornithine deacetylase/succinyl-diaminopimelate desuccinylase family protein
MTQLKAVEIAKELIKFDTSGPPTQEQPCAEWIQAYLDELGFKTTLQIIEPGRANIIAKYGAGKKPGVVLSGHIDVVLAGDPGLWKVSGPFEPVIKDGRLYGRGACDMKGPDACMIQAAQELIDEDFKKQLTLVFTAGEDTGGWFVDRVLSDKLVTPKDASFGVIGEPSLMKIIPVHKGSGGAEVLIHGQAAHSSRPELGINAIQKAADFLYELRKLQEELNLNKHPLLGSTTVECTMMKGGFKANIIPDQAHLTINFRFIPGHEAPATSKKWLMDIINKLSKNDSAFKADILSNRAGVPLDVPLDSPVVTILKDILGTEPIGEPYYTEAVSYAKAGVPTVICGPGSIDQAHTPDEYISLEQIDHGVETYKELIKRVCL